MSQNLIQLSVFEDLKIAIGADFINEVIDAFFEEAPELITALEQSLEASDIDTFRRSAHSLKSNGACFGAIAFSEAAKELEFLAKDGELDQVGDKVVLLRTQFESVRSELEAMKTH